MKNFKSIIALVAVLIIGGNFADVQAQGKQKSARQYDYQMMTTKAIAEQRVEMLSSKVNLSEEQKEKVLQIEIKLADRQMFLKEKYKGSKNREEIKNAHLEAQNAHAEALKEVLTEEQYVKIYTSTVAEHVNTNN